VNHPVTKSVLSEPQTRLVELLQKLNFGRIEGLQVRYGEPVFDPAPHIVQKLKMGGDNSPRPESRLPDFWLKKQIVELLETIATLGEGEIRSIEIAHGLPLLVEIEHRSIPGGSAHA
jgi:hypothetical protein